MNCIKALIPHPTVPEVIATASYDRRVVVWNVKNGSVLAKFKSKVPKLGGVIQLKYAF